MRKLVIAAAALIMVATQVVAQEKPAAAPKARLKVMAENARLRAYELNFAPGAENVAAPGSSTRVVRVLTGGTLERTYPDGKKETVNYKTGEVRINQSSLPVTTKNVGSSRVRLYVVQLK